MAPPPTAWIAAGVLAAAVLGPALGPGYVLNADEVFVPQQDLLPWMLGVGGGLPRAVPQDAVVAALSGAIPGWVWEKSALVALVVLLAVGVGRLARPRGRGTAVVAAVVAVWSGYVAERLLLGHWSLLLAVAALPWALSAAARCREGRRGAGAQWLLWLALASLTATGGLLVLGLTLPILLWPAERGSGRRRAAVATGGLLLQAPWVVPALLHGSATTGAAGADVFAARAEGPWGIVLTLLGTGGAWNAAAVPGSRTTWWAVAVVLVVVAVAGWGARDLVGCVGRPTALTLAVGSVAGLLWAAASAWPATQPVVAQIVGSIPGGGILRDAQKWIAPWLLTLALCAGLGAARLARAVADRTGDAVAARAVLALVVVLPVAAMPDLAWGASGRLAAVAYPDDLGRVRAALEDQPPGDAVSLPWETFRRFPWNLDGRTSLDPVPRAMPRTTLASGSLAVLRDGDVVVIPGDDPRASRIDAAVEAGRGLGPALAAEGVRYAVVAADVPDSEAQLPAGSRLIEGGSSFRLYELSAEAGPVPDRPVLPSALALALALLVVMGAAASIVTDAAARRRGAPARALR